MSETLYTVAHSIHGETKPWTWSHRPLVVEDPEELEDVLEYMAQPGRLGAFIIETTQEELDAWFNTLPKYVRSGSYTKAEWVERVVRP